MLGGVLLEGATYSPSSIVASTVHSWGILTDADQHNRPSLKYRVFTGL
jgi:hypothetical protein